MGVLTPEYRWLLPAVLTGAVDARDRPARRSTRDWIIDSVCFALGAGFALLGTADLLTSEPTMLRDFPTSDWLVRADLVAGLLAGMSLWWRRRWPVGIALALIPMALGSLASTVTLLIMLLTVAVHRRFAVVAAVGALYIACGAVFGVLRPDTSMPYGMAQAWNTTIVVLVVLWGMVVRARRQLVASLRDRAERAESEQQMRMAQARAMERTRIAREMHDVLAHRISLLSLHAGALEIRPDAAADDVARAAGVIRASAHQALQDLRQVIGVLRDASADTSVERPQPTLGELAALVEESRAAGTRVRLDLRIDGVSEVPDGIGRAAYRIVQEGLTNARKHGPGTAVTVAVEGSASAGLTVEVRNPCPVGGSPAAIPGAGTGLIGLAERATLAGGRLTHGRTAGGEFVLRAWLPWPS